MKKHVIILLAAFSGFLLFSEPLFSMGQRPPQREMVITTGAFSEEIKVSFGWKETHEQCGRRTNNPNKGFIVFSKFNTSGILEPLLGLNDPSDSSKPFRIPFSECRGGLNIRILGLEGNDFIWVDDRTIIGSDGIINCFNDTDYQAIRRDPTPLRAKGITAGCHFIIDGGEGSDRIWGSTLNDIIIGGPGDDELHGDLGDDVIQGDEGHDSIQGNGRLMNAQPTCRWFQNENNFLYGGNGHDRLIGSCKRDIISGDAGNDYLDGDEGEDILTGGFGADTLVDRASVYWLPRGDRPDRLHGDYGNDILCEDIEISPRYDSTFLSGGGGKDKAFVRANQFARVSRDVESTCRDPNQCGDLATTCRTGILPVYSYRDVCKKLLEKIPAEKKSDLNISCSNACSTCERRCKEKVHIMPFDIDYSKSVVTRTCRLMIEPDLLREDNLSYYEDAKGDACVAVSIDEEVYDDCSYHGRRDSDPSDVYENSECLRHYR